MNRDGDCGRGGEGLDVNNIKAVELTGNSEDRKWKGRSWG